VVAFSDAMRDKERGAEAVPLHQDVSARGGFMGAAGEAKQVGASALRWLYRRAGSFCQRKWRSNAPAAHFAGKPRALVAELYRRDDRPSMPSTLIAA